MTPKDIYKLLEDYPSYPKRIVKLNHDIHDIMKAMTENCQQMAIKGVSLSGLPKGNRIPDPVYSAFMETEKLTRQYQDKITEIAVEIISLMDKKSKVDAVLNTLDPCERNVLELRFMKRLPWHKISDMMAYSDRQCRTIKDKAISRIMTNIA